MLCSDYQIVFYEAEKQTILFGNHCPREGTLTKKERGRSSYLLGVKKSGFGISSGVQPQKVHSGAFATGDI